ncbi:unnamed protein product [Brassica oleracea]
MTRASLPVSVTTSSKSPLQAAGGTKSFWFEGDGFVHDVDCFVKTIATIKANGARPGHIGSIIAHYASTRLPDLSGVILENQQQYSHSVTAHTCGTLLDVELLTRVVKNFARIYNEGIKSGTSLIKVAKLVDSYLAEAAADRNLSLIEFITYSDLTLSPLVLSSRFVEDRFRTSFDPYGSNVNSIGPETASQLVTSLEVIGEPSEEPLVDVTSVPTKPVKSPVGSGFDERPEEERETEKVDVEDPSTLLPNAIGNRVEAFSLLRRLLRPSFPESGIAFLARSCAGSYRRWAFARRVSTCFFSTNDVEKKNGGEVGDNKEGEEEFALEDLTTVLGDAIASSGQVDNREDPTALIIPDQQIKRNREGKRLKKEMNLLMEQLVEAQKIVDEATHHQHQNLPNPDKFGLLTKTTRINNHIHVPDDSDLCTLKYGGSNQPINARYCCSTPSLFKEV